MEKNRIRYLLDLYAADEASGKEVEELFVYLRSAGGGEALKSLIADAWRSGSTDVSRKDEANAISAGQDWDKMWSAIQLAMHPAPRARIFSFGRMRAAAILILCIGAGAVYLLVGKSHLKTKAMLAAAKYRSDIVPGGNKAVLTLADGSTIVLDSAKDGTLAQQGNAKVVKIDAGMLAYNGKMKGEAGAMKGGASAMKGGVSGMKGETPAMKEGGGMMYNTIATPYGGQYQVILPDGSKVWLNAASSLRFPTSFSGRERVVELMGEGYFEIAKDPSKPFRVHVVHAAGAGKEMNIEVLGTAFNIMAYENEEHSNTTLLNGKVRVELSSAAGTTATNAAAVVSLEPGRQAIAYNQTDGLQVADANVDQVIAWKNGLFRFRETGIRELMRQVERWYNVEVISRTDTKDKDFTGIVSRSQNIQALLHTLELTGTVHFQIDGRKIIVLP
jgi:ferric-dicitrate binding protein FerR (iron transport regulator)